MPVVSRLIASVALGCVLASSLISPVTGSSVQALSKKHHAKKHHHAGKSGALAARAKHAGKRDVTKDSHCKAKVTTSVAQSTTTSHSASHTTSNHSSQSAPASKNTGSGGAGTAPPPASAPASAPPSGGGSGGGGKKQGLSWTDNSLNQKPFTYGASWCYNWGCDQDCSKPGGGVLDWYPMFYCDKSIDAWKQNIMGHSWNAILGFNEPEIPGQCNISPSHGVQLWEQYISPVNAGTKCSPAVTASPTGHSWLTDFIAGCNGGCHFDVVCIHIYTITAANAIKQIEEFTSFGKPIWITEIGCQDYTSNQYCTDSMAQAMMEGVMSYVYGANSPVDKIAWYQFAQSTNIDQSNLMITGNDEPTEIAKIFLGYS